MRSPSRKRFRLHLYRPRFSRFVQSTRARQVSGVNHYLAETFEPDSLLRLLELLLLEVCFLGLSSASYTGSSCVSTCHGTHTRQQNRICPRMSFRLTVVFLAFAFLLAFSFLALPTPSLRAFHLPDVDRC